MLKNYFRTIICLTLVFSFLSFTQTAKAQVGGSSFFGSRGEFSVTVAGGYFQKNIYTVENSAPRFFLKGQYGLSNRVDFFAQVGAAKLTLTVPGQTRIIFRDKHRLAYGAGMIIRPLTFEPLRLSTFFSGQINRFVNKPSVQTNSRVAGSDVIESSALNYDWREADLKMGLSKAFRSLNIYSGVNIKFIQRIETRVEKLIFNGATVTESRQSGEYNSGAIVSPMIGAELLLPARLSLNFEVSANSDTDFVFFIGISQTGRP